MRFAVLAALVSSVVGLRPASLRPSRRDICAALPLIPLLAAQRCGAVCTCPNGFDSCVCTADPEPVISSVKKGAVGTVKKRRVDAAARDLDDARDERAAYDSYVSGKQQAGPKGAAKSAAVQSAPAQAQYLGLSGGGSQNSGEVDTGGAKERFAMIVRQTVQKREAEFGFELDADDIKQIEAVLRPKYCGKAGLIGPC